MQIHRLFEIIYLLLNKGKLTASELAEHFEVSTRTIYRDVELLSSSGIPIYMTKGKGGGVSLLSNFVLNKTMLTEEEKRDILSSLQAVKAVSLTQTPTAIQKLSSLFGSEKDNWIEIDFSGWANAESEASLFDTLKSAILTRQKVRFLYHSSADSIIRIVEPLKLCFKGQGWYLYGYCTLRQDYRFFKLRRIKELASLNESFDRETPAKVLTAAPSFQDDFVTITLKLSEQMAFRVYDEFPQYSRLPDNRFLVHLTMPKGEWIYQYLATFGEYCEVLEPENMRLQIKEKLQKTLASYQ